MGFFNGFKVGDAAMTSVAALVALGISCSQDVSEDYAVPAKTSDRVVADAPDVYSSKLMRTATQTPIPTATVNPWDVRENVQVPDVSPTPLSYADDSSTRGGSVDEVVDAGAPVSAGAVLVPSPTATVVPPTLTATVFPTATVVPTVTATVVPPTATVFPTATVVPPTLTATVFPTATVVPTVTATVVPPTLTATVFPTATVVPTVTATVVPPTATVVPTSTAVLVPSATPFVQKGVRWEVGGKVSLEHRRNIEYSVGLMEDYANFLGFSGVGDGVSVYVYNDLGDLSSAYERVTGVDKDYAFENHWLSGDRSGLAGEGYVFFNTSVSWYSEDPDYQMHLAVHEFSHAQRYRLSDLLLYSGIDEVPEAGPRWLDEGVSEFHAYQALSFGGVVSYDESREDHVRNSGFYGSGSLRGMEVYSGFLSGENNVAYPMLAAELLASIAGQSSLIDFYGGLDVGDDWRDEFRQVFGIGVDAYYGLFEDHVSAGFPKLELPK